MDSVKAKFEAWMNELLDLSGRNRLLHFRKTKRGVVELPEATPGDLFSMFADGGAEVEFLPVPEADEAADEPSATAVPAISGPGLQANLGADDLRLSLTNLHRRAEASISEQGIHTLYLALGFLYWYEAEHSDVEIRSPLLLLPVELSRRKGAKFSLQATGDPVESNLVLAEKLKRDFQIELPEWDDEKSEAANVGRHFAEVSNAVGNLDRAQVQETCLLSIFSFAKLVMYRDLERNEVQALEHPLIRGLCGDVPKRQPVDYPIGEELDEQEHYESTYHILDADSSQREAIAAARAGRSFVLVGPPGTGKSQTIANIMADMMANGKRVLFVSEKAAALEVVYDKLADRGLERYCLNLHNPKGRKRDVIDQLRESLTGAPPSVDRRTQVDVASLEDERASLNQYAEALHTPFGALDLTPFEVHGRVARQLGVPEIPLVLAPSRSAERPHSVPPSEVTVQEHTAMLKAARALPAHAAVLGEQESHPWWGYKYSARTMEERRSTQQVLERLSGSLPLCLQLGSELAQTLGMNAPGTTAECERLTQLTRLVSSLGQAAFAGSWLDGAGMFDKLQYAKEAERQAGLLADAEQAIRHTYAEEIFEQDAAALSQRFEDYEGSWWRLVFGSGRDRRLLRRHQQDRKQRRSFEDQCADVKLVSERHCLRAWFDENQEAHAALFGHHYASLATDWHSVVELCTLAVDIAELLAADECPSQLRALLTDQTPADGSRSRVVGLGQRLNEAANGVSKDASWLQESFRAGVRPSPLDAEPASSMPLAASKEWVTDHIEQFKRLREWSECRDAIQGAQQAGLKSLVDAIRKEPGIAPEAERVFETNFLRCFLEDAYEDRPSLGRFGLSVMDRTLAEFRSGDRETIETSAVRVAQRVAEHRGDMAFDGNAGQTYTLRREFEKKRRHKPVRRLLSEVPEAIQKLTPCMLMSPLTVSQYLSTDRIEFDVVIFDEASQVKPADAMPALMRAPQTVIAGDPKQLPPTAFFETDRGDEVDEAELDPLDSILGEMLVWLGEVGLRWHYRSRDDTLIAFSNREFYENRLVTFPNSGNSGEEFGVEFHHCSGVWDRGKSRTNRIEAGEVARLVRELHEQHPSDSIGVVAFSETQRQAVHDAVETECESLLADDASAEPFFIKNLEAVQGDERDFIVLSVGYGRDQTGRMRMTFGPLNAEGGERRLNVAVTRARKRLLVVSSITAADIRSDVAAGALTLKHYLEYAEHGPEAFLARADAGSGETESWFEQAVLDALVERGLEVKCQVGCSGYRIDLALVDPERPGRYLLGIECDGRNYHSARTARDRDRLRQDVLENLGWRIVRIWSTDWLQNPERQLERVTDALSEAKAEETREPAAEVSPSAEPTIVFEEEPDEEAPVENEDAGDAVGLPQTTALPNGPTYESYQAAALGGLGSPNTFYREAERRGGQMVQAIGRVVASEGPVHVDVVCQRIIEAYGIGRCGHRIRESLERCFTASQGTQYWHRHGDFLWPPRSPQLCVRTNEGSSAPRKIEEIALEEIAQAASETVTATCGIDRDDLTVEVARALGFARTGGWIRQRIEQAIVLACGTGSIVVAPDGTLLPGSGPSPSRPPPPERRPS